MYRFLNSHAVGSLYKGIVSSLESKLSLSKEKTASLRGPWAVRGAGTASRAGSRGELLRSVGRSCREKPRRGRFQGRDRECGAHGERSRCVSGVQEHCSVGLRRGTGAGQHRAWQAVVSKHGLRTECSTKGCSGPEGSVFKEPFPRHPGSSVKSEF